jgi:hypothetical protein
VLNSLRGLGLVPDLEDKKGTSPDRCKIGPGIFFNTLGACASHDPSGPSDEIDPYCLAPMGKIFL